jgi:hypothetical protein
MSAETRIGYGFLLAGVAMPYLIDKLFGAVPAMIASGVCLIAGAALLVTGQRRMNQSEQRKQEIREAIRSLFDEGANLLQSPISEEEDFWPWRDRVDNWIVEVRGILDQFDLASDAALFHRADVLGESPEIFPYEDLSDRVAYNKARLRNRQLILNGILLRLG